MSTALQVRALVDLDDTGSCPAAAECALCGAADGDLLPVTIGSSLGVYCVTACEPCHQVAAATGVVAPVRAAVAADAVTEHCRHLRCDRATMTALLAGEAQAQWRAVTTVVTDR